MSRPGLSAQFWAGFVFGLILMGPVWMLLWAIFAGGD